MTKMHQQWTYGDREDLLPYLDGEDDEIFEFAIADRNFAIILKNGMTYDIADTEDEAILKEKRAIIQALDVCLSNPRTIKDIQDGEITVIEAAREVLQVYDVLPQAVEEVNEIMSAKKRIVEAVEAAAADTANADNCIADYHFTVEAADEDGKNIKKLSIVFEN